ncbi:hypothetical protein [Pseudodesulfovibrio sediminis]|uniref:hypothetical protein n=1 Tax=Pseudodesulfovibrio sediminis TaxID=2810563 RepID=UPI001E433334|nr:hypothetical protein [Pseudodesulfovibrio sediminis]
MIGKVFDIVIKRFETIIAMVAIIFILPFTLSLTFATTGIGFGFNGFSPSIFTYEVSTGDIITTFRGFRPSS